MKVIFLDIDGVMNGPRTPCRWDKDGLLLQMDQEVVFMFNKMIDAHDYGVVLSSTWRLDPKWRETMRANGFIFEFLDRTPRPGLTNYEQRPRGHEIKDWIETWDKEHPEDRIERYAIIDDESDMLDEQLPNFFQTKGWHPYPPKVGGMLTQEMCDAIVAHLGPVDKKG